MTYPPIHLKTNSWLVFAMFLFCGSAQPAVNGRVIDGTSRQPIAGAILTTGGATAITDKLGCFRIEEPAEAIGVRAAGYMQTQVDRSIFRKEVPEITLTPFRPKALYLSVYGIGSRALRESALDVARRSGLNALVIDIKGDRGMIPYRSSIPLAARSGANKIITVDNIQALTKDLHARGLYLIARIVVFKDDPLAAVRPDLAVKTSGGRIWRDREGIAWTDPFRKEVWDYNIDVAVEAAKNGFDEIQFDYLRFPDATGTTYSVLNTEENRVHAISGFLKAARSRLGPLNVFVAIDIFGYVCWNVNDTRIGQKIEELAPLVDYVCPMLYPSGFQFGIPGYRIPVAYPYEIVSLSLERARERISLSPNHLRPWLQAFQDYAFDRRSFGAREIAAQVRAADEFGSNGWMLWNPHNVYSADTVGDHRHD